MDFCFWEDETIQGVNDREGGEDCGGADQVVWFCVEATAQSQDLFCIGCAEVFSAGAFRRFLAEIRIVQECLQELRDEFSLRGELGVFVVALAAVGEVRTRASMSMLPGPVSKARTSDGLALAGITVRLAMPPMFSATRPSFLSRQRR